MMLLRVKDTGTLERITDMGAVIPNGTIQVYTTEGGGYDEHGNPVQVTETLGEPIPCNWKRNTYEKRSTYENGKFTAASYVILVDIREFAPCRFLLKDSKGNSLGEYMIQQKGIAFLDYVGCIELTV